MFLSRVREKTTVLKKKLLFFEGQPKAARLSKCSVHYPASQKACYEFNESNLLQEQMFNSLQFMFPSPKQTALTAQ